MHIHHTNKIYCCKIVARQVNIAKDEPKYQLIFLLVLVKIKFNEVVGVFVHQNGMVNVKTWEATHVSVSRVLIGKFY